MFKRKNNFELSLNKIIKSMVEISYEFADRSKEIDFIYIFCSIEESVFFTFFYKINGVLVKRHKLNDFLNKSCDVSPERQFAADDIGHSDLYALQALFEDENKDKPLSIKISYNTKTSKFSTDFIYEKLLMDSEYGVQDLVEDWKLEIN